MRWFALFLALLLTWDVFTARPRESAFERAIAAVASTPAARSLARRLHDRDFAWSERRDYGYGRRYIIVESRGDAADYDLGFDPIQSGFGSDDTDIEAVLEATGSASPAPGTIEVVPIPRG